MIYLLKMVPEFQDWMEIFSKIHRFINNRITTSITTKETLIYQVQLSQRNGGFGLRDPKHILFMPPRSPHGRKKTLVYQIIFHLVILVIIL